MLVDCILQHAGKQLAVIDGAQPVQHAADLMAQLHLDLLVVQESNSMTGVVTKTDIVNCISRTLGAGLENPVKAIMAREVVYCRTSDPLVDVWHTMRERGIQRIPIVDDARTPVGVVHTRDVLQRLFCDAEIEDELLRDYISGVGYR